MVSVALLEVLVESPAMHTQCPTCRTLYLLHAKIADTLGVAYCPNCKYVFDALASLRADAGKAQREAPETQSLGDRQVLRSRVPLAQPWRVMDHTSQGPLPPPPPAIAVGDPAGTSDATTPTGHGLQSARLLLGLGLRNLLRNRKRSVVALAAISFGVIALLLAGAFMEWIFWKIREDLIHGKLGHVQVTQVGYRESGAADPFAYLMADDDPARARIEAMPHVRLIAPRLAFSGLLNRNDASTSFIGEGVDPVKEAELSTDFRIDQGDNLHAADTDTVILGSGLAVSIDAKPGDTVTLLGKTESGGLNAVQLRVAGIFVTSNKAWNEMTLRVPQSVAETLVRKSGAQTWAVLLDETERTDEVMAALRRDFGGEGATLEFTSWISQADFYTKTVVLYKRQMNFVRTVIALIMIISISNMLTMNVMERIAEIGTLMATGFRRVMILRLFLGEGLMLGVIGGLAGSILGVCLAMLISWIGIPMPPAPSMEEGFIAEMLVTPALIVAGQMLAILTTLLASIIPARKAAALQIVDALRHGK